MRAIQLLPEFNPLLTQKSVAKINMCKISTSLNLFVQKGSKAVFRITQMELPCKGSETESIFC